ncbi:extended synaptotagmin-1-like, partial [Passer montanus]|uniref:extended synaptotagmin-1-like n=1 Tax=Passer montanus TaxID=9160 RepID=UPI001961695E
MRAAERLHREEEAAVRAAAAGMGAARGELPAWVSFPDVERAEWLNKVLAQAWPFLGQFLDKLLQQSVLAQAWPFLGQFLDKLLQQSVSVSLSDSMIMDSLSSYLVLPNRLLVPLVPDLPEAAQLRCPLPRGVVRVTLVAARALRSKDRFLGGLVQGRSDPYALLRVGTQAATSRVIGDSLDPVWDEVYEVSGTDRQGDGQTDRQGDGQSSLSDSMIMDSLSSYLVLPNRLLVPLVPDLPEAAQLRCPLPRGVVRVTLVAARALRSKDRFLGGLVQGRSDPYALLRVGTQAATSRVIGDSLDPVWDEVYEGVVRVTLVAARALRSKDRFLGGLVQGRSDPYALLRVGTQAATSRVIGDSLDPTWDEVYEFMVHEVPGQELEVELFDKDPDKDDLLGRMKLDLGEVLKARVMDEWFPLQEGGQGRLHLRLEWLSLLSDASKLDQVLEKNQKIVAKPDPPSSAILVVYLDRAEGLPERKPGKEPNPVVQVSVQDVTRESKVVCNTSAPVWEDAFRFFLHDPRDQEVDFQVIVDDVPGQDVEFELFDKDIDKDDFLGSPVRPLPTLVRPPPAPQVLHTNRLLQPQHGPALSAALLRVFLDRAAELPLRKGSKPPAAFASLAVRDVSFKTKTCAPSTEPMWDEGFSFLIQRPHEETLELQVKEEGGHSLGTLSLPLARLLEREGLALDGWLPLAGGAQLLLRAQLGVLVSQRVEESAAGREEEEEEEEEGGDEESGGGGPVRPLPTLVRPPPAPQVLHTNRLLQPQHGPALSAALLRVFLDRAAELPLRKGSKPPSAFASLAVRDVSFKTKTCAPSTEPVWDEGFSFLIQRPHEETLELQVKGEGGHSLGTLSLPLARLLEREGLALDGWLPLAGGAQLLLRAQLGVLVSQRVEESAAGREEEEEEEEEGGDEE